MLTACIFLQALSIIFFILFRVFLADFCQKLALFSWLSRSAPTLQRFRLAHGIVHAVPMKKG